MDLRLNTIQQETTTSGEQIALLRGEVNTVTTEVQDIRTALGNVAGSNAGRTAGATTSSPSAQGGTIDDSTCLDISSTKDDLMLAASPDKARKSADTLEKYSPPDPVKAAIEHFVTTVGARPNDPDIDANRNLIMGWLKQICPNLPSLKN